MYIDKLNDGANKYTPTYDRTIKMKPVDVNSSTYIDFIIENYDKFKGCNQVRISKYKNFLQKTTLHIGLKKVLQLKKVKHAVPWTYVICDLNGKEIFRTFYKKELQKTNQRELKIKKVIKRKDDKVYVKWKGNDNSWIQ